MHIDYSTLFAEPDYCTLFAEPGAVHLSGNEQAAGPQGSGWAAFEMPADEQQSPVTGAVSSLPQPTANHSGFEGWQAFDGGAHLTPAPSAPEPAAATPQQQEPNSRGSLIMKELPSVSTLLC